MEPLYRPQGVERAWQRDLGGRGPLQRRGRDPRETFVICLPPPNVTGQLHMGHALNTSAQDVLIRWHRMRGFNTLWQPGYDHAGHRAPGRDERRLAGRGQDAAATSGARRSSSCCWDFIDEYGGQIMGQLRSLGASLDYRRHALHDGRRLHARGHALLRAPVGARARSTAATASSTGARAARARVSDLEVEHSEVDDTLTWIRYPLADGDGHVTIATVRPPTMLADVAVAVHPGRRALPRPRRAGGDRPGRRAARADHRRRARRARRSAPARSRSRPGTTRWTGRSGATTGCPSRW